MQYLGHREWQMGDFHRDKGNIQPELSRTEYLRLLSAAKHLGKEKAYLLIKTLGGAGMRVQELPQLTLIVILRATDGFLDPAVDGQALGSAETGDLKSLVFHRLLVSAYPDIPKCHIYSTFHKKFGGAL